MQHSPEFGVAMSFTTLIWCRTLQTFPARSNTQTAIQAGFFANKVVLIAVVVCSALFSLTMIPGLKEVFSIPTAFGVSEILICLGIAFVTILLMEITKLIIVHVQNGKEKE
ncbi:Calcium-transporting ATPase 1 [bioreactor metagenome]